MRIYTKESLIEELRAIRDRGWIANARHGNVGSVGNTLEDLLGIEENNLPIPNASEWELKCQRLGTTSLTTLFHMEPSPRAMRFVPGILLPLYGWPHQSLPNEMSFRQTITGRSRTDRGFGITVDRNGRKVMVSFDSQAVNPHHAEWLQSVRARVGLGELNPQPYWGFEDLEHKAGTKLLNCFYIRAHVKRENGREFFHYCEISILERFDFEHFLASIEDGAVLVDFDARTGHNHGTKFRLRQDCLDRLYSKVTRVE